DDRPGDDRPADIRRAAEGGGAAAPAAAPEAVSQNRNATAPTRCQEFWGTPTSCRRQSGVRKTLATASAPRRGAVRRSLGDVPSDWRTLVLRLLTALLAGAALAALSAADEKLKGIACRSVHLGYPAPEGTAFYNEVTVEASAPGTYFMVCGWSKGYF